MAMPLTVIEIGKGSRLWEDGELACGISEVILGITHVAVI
jgi:hypothetical protein